MIKRAVFDDAPDVARLALKLWPDHTVAELTADFETTVMRTDSAVFLLMDGSDAVGFAQCALRRDYVEGTDTCPVAYLEGIYVDAPYRHRGNARCLVSACEQWGREMGCSEFASDCEMSNDASLAFHLKLGFEEANRIICFTKHL